MDPADTAVRKALVGGLDGDHHDGVVAALADVGTVEDVPALRAASGTDAAVKAIQGRVEGAAPGKVSLADARGGAVSVARQTEGSWTIRPLPSASTAPSPCRLARQPLGQSNWRRCQTPHLQAIGR